MSAGETARTRARRRARGRGPVEVLGAGTLADRLRERLAPLPAPDRGRPRTVVETTGEPAQLARAFELVDDLGTVVLAGPLQGGAAIDLYADVHVRGLTLVAIPPSSEDRA